MNLSRPRNSYLTGLSSSTQRMKRFQFGNETIDLGGRPRIRRSLKRSPRKDPDQRSEHGPPSPSSLRRQRRSLQLEFMTSQTRRTLERSTSRVAKRWTQVEILGKCEIVEEELQEEKEGRRIEENGRTAKRPNESVKENVM